MSCYIISDTNFKIFLEAALPYFSPAVSGQQLHEEPSRLFLRLLRLADTDAVNPVTGRHKAMLPHSWSPISWHTQLWLLISRHNTVWQQRHPPTKQMISSCLAGLTRFSQQYWAPVKQLLGQRCTNNMNHGDNGKVKSMFRLNRIYNSFNP